MAEKEKKSLSKLLGEKAKRAQKALRDAADKPVTYGFIPLPGGINGGIARLTSLGFETYRDDTNAKMWDGNKEVSAAGELYFRGVGAVVHPAEHEGQNLKGCTTSVMVNLFDQRRFNGTVTTLEDNIVTIRNYLGQLAGEEAVQGAGLEDFEAIIAAILEEKPYFKFSTKYGKANPTRPDDPLPVYENWHGRRGLEDWVPESDEDHEQDDTDTGEEDPKPSKSAKSKTSSKSSGSGGDDDDGNDKEVAFSEFDDLDGLALKADKGDKKAQVELKKLALKAGLTEEFVDDEADTWAQVARAIAEGDDEGGESEGEEESSEPEGPTFNPGDIVQYKPKGSRKASSFKVLSIGEDGSLSLRSLTDKTVKFTDVDPNAVS